VNNWHLGKPYPACYCATATFSKRIESAFKSQTSRLYDVCYRH
jgi:hypothetical protein